MSCHSVCGSRWVGYCVARCADYDVDRYADFAVVVLGWIADRSSARDCFDSSFGCFPSCL